MVDFLFSLPLWVLAVVLNTWLMGFALLSLWALRRWLLPRLRINTDVEDARFQGILVAGLAGFVAMVLFVIIALDRPFRGAMAIPADSYQLVYDQLMKR